MSDFEYVALAAPHVVQPVNINDLLKSMTDMVPENVSFIGGFYGEPGMGKTTAAMELMQRIVPQDKKILYVYTGTNWSSLMNFPHLMRRTKKMQFTGFGQLKGLGEMLANKELVEKIGIGGVIFDEYNTMYEMDLDGIVGYNAHVVNSGPKKRGKDGQEVYKDPHTPQWPDYNIAKTHVIDLMNDLLRSENVHMAFVAHSKLQKSTGMQEPDMNPAAAQAFIRSLHSLYYLENSFDDDGKMKRTIQLQGTGQTVAKNRIGGLPNKVFSVDPIVEAYEKWGIQEERDAVPQEKKAIEPPVEEKVSEPVAQKEPVQETPDIDIEAFLA